MSCATQVYFSEKSTWMRACEFAMLRECCSLRHCSFLFLLLCYCLISFCVAMLEELGQNGNDTLLQIVGCSIIKNFAQFVGFVISPNVPMLLHSLPVKYLYTLRGSINIHNIHSASSALNIKLLEPLAQGASRFEKLLAPRKIYWPPFFPDRRLYS